MTPIAPHAARQQAASVHVRPQPVDDDSSFTFERAEAYQCTGLDRYIVSDDSAEALYFEPKLRLVLQKAISVPGAQVDGRMKQMGSEVHALRYVTYEQLKNVPYPSADSLALRPSAQQTTDYTPAEEWEMYKTPEGKAMVQAPQSLGGHHFEIMNLRGQSFGLEFTVLCPEMLEDVPPGASPKEFAFSVCYRARNAQNCYVPATDKVRQMCCVVRCGEMLNGSFHRLCPEVYLHNKSLSDEIFLQSRWPVTPAPEDVGERNPLDADLDVNDLWAGLNTGVKSKHEFAEHDGQLCILQPAKKKDEEGIWMPIASFWIESIVAAYEFVESHLHPPYICVRVRQLINPDGVGSYHVSGFDNLLENGASSQYKHMTADVNLNLTELRDHRDVRAAFQRVGSSLVTIDLTPNILANFLVTGPHRMPPPTRVICRWGRQSSGMLVFANICISNGSYLSHAECEIGVVPKFFEQSLVPMSPENFPRVVVIEPVRSPRLD